MTENLLTPSRRTNQSAKPVTAAPYPGLVPAPSPAPEPAGPHETNGPVPLVLASPGPAGSRPASNRPARGRRLASPGPAASRRASTRPAGGRGRPPRHLADLPLAERRAVVAGLGQPPF